MGMALFPAGVGHAGIDPAYVLPRVAYTPPRAVYFDPAIRGWRQNADGTLADLHPVDQAVAILLFFDQGSSPSQPGLGTRIRQRIRRVDARKIPLIALDEVTTALQPLIDAGAVQLVSVATDASQAGRALFAIQYLNLRDPSLNPNNTAASIRTLPI